MKIMLVITRSELGGAQTVVVQLANALCHEHDVVLVAGEGDGKMWELVDKRVTRESLPHLQRGYHSRCDPGRIAAVQGTAVQAAVDRLDHHSLRPGAAEPVN